MHRNALKSGLKQLTQALSATFFAGLAALSRNSSGILLAMKASLSSSLMRERFCRPQKGRCSLEMGLRPLSAPNSG